MSAKAFAYATGCAVFGVEAFSAIALQVPENALRLHVIADAQQGKVYVQRFVRPAATAPWEAESDLRIEMAPDWLGSLPNDAWVAGPGLTIYRDGLKPGLNQVDAALWDPQPQSLLRLALPRFHRNESDDSWTLEPSYLRPSSAEEKWRATSR
jgi:tRNA threonylcarbamoyladenosine biosynthesis protein TsaB